MKQPKVKWFDMNTIKPIGTFIFNRPILLVRCHLSPGQYLAARNHESQFHEFHARAEQHERKMQHSRQQQVKARVRRAARGVKGFGIMLNEDGTWKRGTTPPKR